MGWDFSGGVEIWDFLMRAVLEVTSRELKNFQRGLGIFGEIKKKFKCRG